MRHHQSFWWCNGLHNFSCNGWGDSGVRAKPEYVYQDGVKLIGHGGAHKHRCALKSLSIQNTCSNTTFLPTSNYMFEVKNSEHVQSEGNCEEIFFPQISASWCKQINKKKTFFVTKISFGGMPVWEM